MEITGYTKIGRTCHDAPNIHIVTKVGDTTKRRYVAKVLHYDNLTEARLRVVNETNLLRQFRGVPHIVQYVDRVLERCPPRVCLITQWCPLGTLSMCELPTLLPRLHQLATAITAVHAAGYIHQDIKPDNVLLDEDGVRLADFGCAYPIGATSADAKAGGYSVGGTPLYASPQLRDALRSGRIEYIPTTADDVWGFGVTAHFAAYGFLPFDWETPATGVDPTVDEVIQRCLVRDVNGRITMPAILALLDGVM